MNFYIIAGNMQQARNYFREQEMVFSPRHVLHEPHCLQGLERGTNVKLIGTWFDRPDWDRFDEMLKERQCVVVET